MPNNKCKHLKKQLSDNLDNLKIELFDHKSEIESIRLISASLDNLLIKLIRDSCIVEDIENELRMLINHLNYAVANQSISNLSYLRISIKYLNLKLNQGI